MTGELICTTKHHWYGYRTTIEKFETEEQFDAWYDKVCETGKVIGVNYFTDPKTEDNGSKD